jgi:peptidyl-prolyl cis-trans isomerase SurA
MGSSAMKVTRWLAALVFASVALSSPALPARAPAAVAPRQPAGEQNYDVRIAAVVNDEAISVPDLAARMKLVMLSSNIPDNPEIRKRIAAQVLRTIIDEKLEMQEAKRKGVKATDAEVKKAVAQLEERNHMPAGQLLKFLKQRDIDPAALINQLTAAIVWAKLVRQRAQEGGPISDEEVDDALKRVKAHADEAASRVAEIFLSVDNPQQDGEVRELAERLIQQMRQGARFSAVAQQFSQSATAAVGGDIGWVRPDQLPAELGKQVATMQPGELSPPIRTPAGYYLLLVLDRRTGKSGSEAETMLDIVQVVFPLPPNASEAQRQAVTAQAEKIRGAANNCPDFLKLGKQRGLSLSSEGKLQLTQIAPAMRDRIMKLPLNQTSEPIVQKNGVGVIMVCSRSSPGAAVPTRQEVEEILARRRIDMVARRYLEDLRRAAYVDVRV